MHETVSGGSLWHLVRTTLLTGSQDKLTGYEQCVCVCVGVVVVTIESSTFAGDKTGMENTMERQRTRWKQRTLAVSLMDRFDNCYSSRLTFSEKSLGERVFSKRKRDEKEKEKEDISHHHSLHFVQGVVMGDGKEK